MGRWGGQSLGHNSDVVALPPASPAPGLFIDPADLNLGEIWEDPETTTTISLRNTSDSAISVSSFGTSCTCSGIEPASVVVPARGSVPLRVKMDLTHRLPHLCGLERRPFSLAIHPMVLQAGVAPNGWELKGVIRSRVALSALRVEFGDRCTRGGTPVTRKVRATAFQALATLELTARTQQAQVQVTPVAGMSGEYEISITPDPKLKVGPFQFDIPLTAVLPDDVRYRCATIEVFGQMQPSTRIVPSIVLLGEHADGAEATAEVCVRFPDPSGWAVDTVIVASPHLTATPCKSFEDGALRYRLVQKITGRGDQVNKVKFLVGKPGSVQESVEMEVRYHGAVAKSR